jgi:hypothetical protein
VITRAQYEEGSYHVRLDAPLRPWVDLQPSPHLVGDVCSWCQKLSTSGHEGSGTHARSAQLVSGLDWLCGPPGKPRVLYQGLTGVLAQQRMKRFWGREVGRMHERANMLLACRRSVQLRCPALTSKGYSIPTALVKAVRVVVVNYRAGVGHYYKKPSKGGARQQCVVPWAEIPENHGTMTVSADETWWPTVELAMHPQACVPSSAEWLDHHVAWLDCVMCLLEKEAEAWGCPVPPTWPAAEQLWVAYAGGPAAAVPAAPWPAPQPQALPPVPLPLTGVWDETASVMSTAVPGEGSAAAVSSMADWSVLGSDDVEMPDEPAPTVPPQHGGWAASSSGWAASSSGWGSSSGWDSSSWRGGGW